jgi:hypothetical protein
MDQQEQPPRVQVERRRGTMMTFVLLGLLILLALLLLFGGDLFGDRIGDQVEQTDVKVKVEPGKGVQKSE